MCRPHNPFKTHGCGGTPLYNVYNQMRYRCRPGNKHPQAKDYVGRGISVCQAWLDDFLTFQAWALANGYQHGLCLDRIDVNGNYEPNNCRWVTRKTQQRNRRHNLKTVHNGRSVVIEDLLDAYGVTDKAERARVLIRIRDKGMTLEQARVEPIRPLYYFEGQAYRFKKLFRMLSETNRIAVCQNTFYNRLAKGWSIIDAKDIPPISGSRKGRLNKDR